jgi:hypothetical protein
MLTCNLAANPPPNMSSLIEANVARGLNEAELQRQARLGKKGYLFGNKISSLISACLRNRFSSSEGKGPNNR